MLARGGGAIVMIGSVNATLPEWNIVDYSATKAALASYAKSLSKEFGPKGIRVNTVSPGPVSTDLWLGHGRGGRPVRDGHRRDRRRRRRLGVRGRADAAVHHAAGGRRPHACSWPAALGQHHRRRHPHRRRLHHYHLGTIVRGGSEHDRHGRTTGAPPRRARGVDRRARTRSGAGRRGGADRRARGGHHVRRVDMGGDLAARRRRPHADHPVTRGVRRRRRHGSTRSTTWRSATRFTGSSGSTGRCGRRIRHRSRGGPGPPTDDGVPRRVGGTAAGRPDGVAGPRRPCEVRAGERILVHGGAGGVGALTVELAGILGADVTTTVRSDAHALVTGLGANHVIDTRTEDLRSGRPGL